MADTGNIEKQEETSSSETSSEHPDRKFGWVRDPYDARDHRYIPSPVQLEKLRGILPPKVDLRENAKNLSVYFQGTLGSCTANASCFAYHYMEMKLGNQCIFSPSRLFLYYNTRALKGDVATDSGASIRMTMKSVSNTGVCTESLWPYDTSKFAVKPTDKCYTQSTLCKVTEYVSVPQILADIKNVLVEGYPIVFGFDVYEGFDIKAGLTGKMPIPNPATEKLVGGHAVCLVGYDDEFQFSPELKGAFIVRNSWGSLWGDAGHFYMPYCVATNSQLADNFWFIKTVTNPAGVHDDPIVCCDCTKCIIC